MYDQFVLKNFFVKLQAKLTKLIKLWQDKSIFDPSTLTKMQHVEETWENCKNQKLDEYQQEISLGK